MDEISLKSLGYNYESQFPSFTLIKYDSEMFVLSST